MELLFDKSFEKIQEIAEKRLMEDGFDISPGSIAKLFTSIINVEIAEFYNMLREYHAQAFLSTATGKYLECIGILLNCKRKDDEDDDKYRERIKEQILNMATANETAIRLTALSVNGVKDVKFRRYSMGAGTFTLIVTSDSAVTEDSILANVREMVDKVVALGIDFDVISPINDYIKMNINLIIDETVSSSDVREIQLNAMETIKDYINSIPIGEDFIVNEFIERVMSVNKDIINFVCREFKINNLQVPFINHGGKWSNRFLIALEPNSITIS